MFSLFAAVFVGVLGFVALPNFVSMASRAKRAEIPHTVNQIRLAQLAHRSELGGFILCSSEDDARGELARDGGKGARDFNPDGDPCWDTMGWGPEGQLRGAYWVEVAADGTDFTVTGIADVDGDGQFAIFVATRDREATRFSSKDAY